MACTSQYHQFTDFLKHTYQRANPFIIVPKHSNSRKKRILKLRTVAGLICSTGWCEIIHFVSSR
jgi:hypothetical protein